MKLDKTTFLVSVGFIVLIGAVIFLLYRISNLKYDLGISNHNYEAAKKEMTTIKLDNDKILHEKDALILSEKNMAEELGMTKKELSKLNRELQSKAEYISKLEASIKIDSVKTEKDSIIYIDNTPAIVRFKMNDKWIAFNGEANLLKGQTTISNISIPLPLKIGITENYSLFAISENPYLNITNIDAVAAENFVRKATKRKHWGFAVYAGFGAHYDVIYNKVGVGPQLGIGFVYRF